MKSIGSNLKRIRLLNNLSLQEAGKLLNMSATAVNKYEKGELLPNSTKIIEFADAYKVPSIEILKTYDVPQMKFNSFRKKQRLTGKNLDLLKEVIQNNVAKYLEVIELNSISQPINNLPNYICNDLIDAENAADKFRQYLGISSLQPISDLINTLENLGIIIIQIKNENNKFNGFDGLSEIINNIPVIVLLNDIKDGARQRFTIAHELGHLLLTNHSTIDNEKICNRFASSLLMPKEATINELGKSRLNISLFELNAFKNEYKVSYSAIVYRLKDLNIISQYTYTNLNIMINKYIGKIDPNPIIEEKSYQFKKIIYKLENDKIISISKACELLGVTQYDYNKQNYRY